MQLTAVFLLAAGLTASATGFSQKVTLSEKNVPLGKVFQDIKKQTGYEFLYTDEMLQGTRVVTIDLKNAELIDVLATCFKDQPLTYTIIENTIVVKPKPPTGEFQPPVSSPPPGEIKGRVTNQQGVPLAGANIIIKRTKRGTETNVNGEFTLSNVNPDDILIVSFIGYKTQTVKVGGGKDFPLTMEVSKNQLDQVEIQGYGTTSQRLTTGSIATVTAADIEKQPVINPLQALQGRVAGVVVTQTSGYASAPIKVEIRGRNTIGNVPSDPLYIIDGVPLTVLEVPGSGSGYATGSTGFVQNPYMPGPANGQSPFFSLNPADIESMTILKDADATAIYGSRGANGVIIVTTKSGKVGKASFEMNIYQGLSSVTRHYDLMNRQQYLEMRNEAVQNDGYGQYLQNPAFNNYFYDLKIWDTTRYTDWQKYVWGNIGKTTDAQMSLSGGSKQTTFRIAAGYSHLTDISTAQGASQRGSIQFNFSHKSNDQKLGITFSNFYSVVAPDMINVQSMALTPPNAPPVYDTRRNLNFAGWYPGQGLLYPFSQVLQPYSSTTYFINSRVNISYEILKGLVASSNFGYSNADANQKYFTPIASQDPATNPTGSSQFGYNSTVNWIVEPQLGYSHFVGNGKIEGLLGVSTQSVAGDGNFVTGSNYTNDNLLSSIGNAPFKNAFDSYVRYKYAAVFGRINYNWRNKYILNASVRRDGSSRFGPGKQFGNFAAMGAAWIFTEENWVKENIKLLSFGKFRASYGTTGNDQIGDYQYLTRWSSSNITPYEGNNSYIPLQHANPDFQWEVNHKLEATLNLNFIKDRLDFEFTWYQNTCNDQLVQYPLPILTGFGQVTGNSPADVRNRGIEMSFRGKIIDQKDWIWEITFNISANRNVLLAFPNLSQSPYANQIFIGKPLYLTNVLHYLGVDPQTGQYTYQDKNKDGVISTNFGPTGDTYPVYLTPKYSGGLGSDLTYKGWDLSLFFHFKKQIGNNAFISIQPPGGISNEPTEMLNRWQRPGDKAAFARYTENPVASDFNLTTSDATYTDASFIRLTNLSLSYSLPVKWTRRTGLSLCRIYLKGQNLITITNYKGVDPETQSFGSMPPSKIITGGFQITL